MEEDKQEEGKGKGEKKRREKTVVLSYVVGMWKELQKNQ